jgi:hypothetical protein
MLGIYRVIFMPLYALLRTELCASLPTLYLAALISNVTAFGGSACRKTLNIACDGRARTLFQMHGDFEEEEAAESSPL